MPGLTSDERDELVRVRRDNRVQAELRLGLGVACGNCWTHRAGLAERNSGTQSSIGLKVGTTLLDATLELETRAQWSSNETTLWPLSRPETTRNLCL
jgi:hypothetical protein